MAAVRSAICCTSDPIIESLADGSICAIRGSIAYSQRTKSFIWNSPPV
jgi:hypothetical protein